MKFFAAICLSVLPVLSVWAADFEQSFYGQLFAGYAWEDDTFNHFSPTPRHTTALGSATLRWMGSVSTPWLRAEAHLHNSIVGDRAFKDPGAASGLPGFRSALLQRHWLAQDGVRGATEIDYLNVSIEGGPWRFVVGRQPINLAQNFYFPVMDFFSPFAFSDFTRLYKPGVDAARLVLALGEFSEFEVIWVLGYPAVDFADNPTRHGAVTGGAQGLSSGLGRLTRNIDSIELGVMGGHIPLANIASAWLKRAIGKTSMLTLESTWAVPEGSFPYSGKGWDASLGLSTQWTPKLNTRLELLAARRQAYSPQPNAVQAETTAFAFGLNREIDALTQGTFLLMFDPDHTALFINLNRSMSDESEISADLAWPLAGKPLSELGAFALPSEAADYLAGPLAYNPARFSLNYRCFF